MSNQAEFTTGRAVTVLDFFLLQVKQKEISRFGGYIYTLHLHLVI